MESPSWEQEFFKNVDSGQMISPGGLSASLVNLKDVMVSRSPSAQIMTPPDSLAGSPLLDVRSDSSSSRNSANSSTGSNDSSASSSPPENTFISVSTTFYPGATIDSLPTDLIILSTESVFFYVHSTRILGVSENGFNQLVSGAMSGKGESEADPIISLPETSTVLNIILHTVYGMSCSHYSPSLDDLAQAITSLPKYGLSIPTHLAPNAPLSATLLSYAPTSPIELYILASSLDLYHIAASTSPHLLSYTLSNLSDEEASRMGPLYLKRLFFLHIGRTEALKRLLLPPPQPHAPTSDCDFDEQKRVTRAWALASAYLLLEARPDMSAGTMESALAPLAQHLGCKLCKQTLIERVREVVVQWSVVKTTI